MSSSDRIQVSHVIHVLELILENPNPVVVLQRLAAAAQAVALPPPGDPAGIRRLAAGYTTMGARMDRLTGEVRTLARMRLPDAWSGAAGATAASVVHATADLVQAAKPAMAVAAAALTRYADSIEKLQRQHHDYSVRLREAWHEVVPAGVLAGPIVDPVRLAGLAGRVAELIAGCIAVYRASLNALNDLEGHLGDVGGRARAQTLNDRGAAKAVLLAEAGIGPRVGADNAILTVAQGERAQRLRAALSNADRARLDAILASAANPIAEAYLLKALAAGHSVADVSAFAAQIAGQDETWLRTHLSLLDPDGSLWVASAGGRIKQIGSTTCGSMSLVMAHAMTDPMYALQLTGTAQDIDSDAFRARLAAEQQAVHERTNTLWPETLGTTPWGMASELNANPGIYGVAYEAHVVDDTDDRSIEPALAAAVTAVDQGHPVPVMIGNAVPRHWVLLVAHDGDTLTFYEPSDGKLIRVGEADFRDGNMSSLGFRHVSSVVTPR